MVYWFNGLMVQWFNGLIPPHVLAITIPTTASIPALSLTPDITAPTIPILISPPNASVTDNSSPEFVWRQSTDGNSNTVIYTLYLNNVLIYPNILDSGNTTASNYSTRQEGDTIHLTPTYALSDGTYSWYVVARDLSLNSSRSATWHFTLDTSIPPLTASITQTTPTTYDLSSLIYLLLAICIALLLIILWRRRYNLILLDSDLRPLTHTTIYHSRTYTPGVKGSHTPGVLSIIHNSSYKLYIPHLSRFSTLTIRIQDKEVCTTTILSLCAKQRVYTIVLG